jgi:2-succinyl-6-hydroxy-2,4-cyclohexadiene-1-carboxylate synthase
MYIERQGGYLQEKLCSQTLPSLLLLHGFMGSSADFHSTISTFSQHFHCICVDLPGHGQTPIATLAPEVIAFGASEAIAFGASEAIDDSAFVSIAEQILAIAPDNCYLFGYSLGGRLALYLALHYPDRWQKVILESASFGLSTTQARKQRQQQDAAIARKLRQPNLDFAAFIQNWYQQSVFTGINQHPNFPELITSRFNNNPLALARSLETIGLGQQPYLGELLKINKIPLLLLAGERDPKFVEIGHQIAKNCPYSEIIVVPNCSHNVHFQQLDLWLKAVLEFLI